MKEIIVKILNESVTAPSPDNFQPWRFEVKDNEIRVFKVSSKVNHLLDFNEHVLMLTLGMLIENIRIAATHYSLSSAIHLFPVESNPELIAHVVLQKNDSIMEDGLYDLISRRQTNRKPYTKQQITTEIIDELLSSQNEFDGIELKIITDHNQVRRLGKEVSLIDQIIFENQELHDSLFTHITWSKEDDNKMKQGLVLDAMEFNAMEKLLFKALKNWKLVSFLNIFGFSKFIRFKNSGQYSSAAASMVVGIQNNSPTDYITAGRFVERLWLRLTHHQIDLHPIVGVLYCYQKVKGEASSLFSHAHSQALESSYGKIKMIAEENGMKNKSIVFYSRIGYAKPPSHKSQRKPAEIKFS